ncbi:hypothetical protein [Allobranchiibius huperziae]|uniref:Cu/Zn superoxide dismutase n=1 Tax=Allobranchiibius huperziae TaxID=1874116 RepID=A0A853DJ42_9MICO|nr:hypothetical protein [Allobranchiibius huperziae]NYJ74740.1 Cu/Zn superoxide dismutase [Allobranchiibius huperziae]
MSTVKKSLALAAAGAACVAIPLSTASSAMADSSGTTYLSAHLTQLNESGASATVTGTLKGDQLSIKIVDSGLLAGAPHAQHIHVGGTNSCPSPTEKGTGVDGHLRVADAQDSYGAIAQSLTTSGDTSPASGLAVTRFPVGTATYSRTFTVPAATATALKDGKAVIVQHGVDYNKDGKYSGSSKSELDPSLPEEATDPADCGVVQASQMSMMPGGGVNTGFASTKDSNNSTAIAGGAAAVAIGAAGVLVMRRRQRTNV